MTATSCMTVRLYGHAHLSLNNVIVRWRNVTYEKIIKEGGPANSTFLQCEQSINYCNDPKVLGEVYFERVRLFFC